MKQVFCVEVEHDDDKHIRPNIVGNCLRYSHCSLTSAWDVEVSVTEITDPNELEVGDSVVNASGSAAVIDQKVMAYRLHYPGECGNHSSIWPREGLKKVPRESQVEPMLLHEEAIAAILVLLADVDDETAVKVLNIMAGAMEKLVESLAKPSDGEKGRAT